MKNPNATKALVRSLLPVGIAIVYVLLGMFCEKGWTLGWLLFLLIPIVETLLNAISLKDPSKFAYPVLMAGIFLVIGLLWGWWNPGWLVFVTIPAYYSICEYIKKTREPQPNQQYASTQAQNGTYFQPNVDTPQQTIQKKGANISAVIITIIVSTAAVLIALTVCLFSLFSGNFSAPAVFKHSNNVTTSVGVNEVDATDIRNIEVEWVSGNVDVDYYDGDKIVFEESGDDPLAYSVKNGKLEIDEFDHEVSGLNVKEKDLKLSIPSSLKLDGLSFEIVSASVDAKDVNASSFKLESVSGNVKATFSSQPFSIDVETVGGDTTVILPADTTGYTVSSESISGDVHCNDFDNQRQYGDGAVKIDFESVGGDLTIAKR